MQPWIQAAAARRPDTVAIETPERTLTYAELAAEAHTAARGLDPDTDRVALDQPAGADFVIRLHACLTAGAAAIPVDLRLTEAERDRRLAATRALTLPAATVAVMFTSGTTAAPKPLTLTRRNFEASALGSAVALGLDPNERWLCPMPLTHVGGLSIPIRSAIYATTAVLHGRFDTEAVLSDLSDPAKKITLVSLVPTMLARLLDAGLTKPPTLRWALLGGGPIAPALLDRAREAGVPVAPTYGMTEACSQIATFGWPLTGVELRIAPHDEEILVRGPIVAPGAADADGWLHTGDLGRLDERGRIEITGRKADTIITGGENVSPTEVEAVLLEHPAVADAGVHARPDPEWGEAVVATVVLRPGAQATAEEVRRHVAGKLARFKVPKEVGFAQELPRTGSGKLIRRLLGPL